MQYDIVIATRNRAQALALSLPLFAVQTHKPNRIIIVDASDNHSEIIDVAHHALDESAIAFDVLQSSVRSSAYQRNRGVQEVTAPIVMMPDDDSLWFSDTAEETIKIYQLDQGQRVGGVTARSVLYSPMDVDTLSYKPASNVRLKALIQPLRGSVENRFFKQPFLVYADDLASKMAPLTWSTPSLARRVNTVGGFRMSFRTDAIRSQKFDELLGYTSGYCQHEDMDASLRIQGQNLLLMSAERSRVFHHSFPGKRSGGFKYGFGQIANYIYICCKVIPRNSRAWGSFSRYMHYKIFLYSIRNDLHWNEVTKGAQFAWSNRALLLDANLESLGSAFRSLCDLIPEPTE
ncbi:glycosyltransferase family A protein [Lichenihabitans sp. Uapishka_5]|uniref:glycosyltransferase family A protein n=1 Tax=Lichenihabitans sp. Uapishka_5 TaxID=3037302 RepID=UPI0029E7D35D|nr:glycosyltransferase family A protein [Lichenihabitans sp. Uapishka_5]MDX7952330.1 glycosyltransferase family A protein [Lichenihabitans sp. Uapishka_5]